MKQKFVHILYPLLALLTLVPVISSGVSLFLGILFAFVFGNPFIERTKSLTSLFLSLAIVGLGAGMNLLTVAEVGFHGIGYTILGIGSTFVIGTLLGKFLKTDRDTSLLITVGTAICGGSAIAAVAPVIRAKSHEVTIALGIVFSLNAIALFLFPFIGHQLLLSGEQFGLWSALAIHDTSSVVGASLQYGHGALAVGTTTKLARALWIVPVAMSIGYIRSKEAKNNEGAQKAKRPWFILGFLAMAALMTFVPAIQPVGDVLNTLAKRLMVMTLFLIGSNLSPAAIKSVGAKPFIQGVLLWVIMASTSLFLIYQNP
jgi:uncharacterized integral membrane protein (TIGR00698 family)